MYKKQRAMFVCILYCVKTVNTRHKMHITNELMRSVSLSIRPVDIIHTYHIRLLSLNLVQAQLTNACK